MDLMTILTDKTIKKMQARKMIIEEILNSSCSISEINHVSSLLDDKKNAVILEAIEEISNKKMMDLSEDYLDFAKKYVSSKNNSCKREASRIIGNMAEQYPSSLEDIIPSLLENTLSEGTVNRWSSAYALSRIIVLKEYRNTDLYEKLASICDNEQENGVKNQYLKAFKKIKKLNA